MVVVKMMTMLKEGDGDLLSDKQKGELRADGGPKGKGAQAEMRAESKDRQTASKLS